MYKLPAIILIALAASGNAFAQSATAPPSSSPSPPPAAVDPAQTRSSADQDDLAGKSEARLSADQDDSMLGQGAHFRIEERGMLVEMQCPPGEQIRECSDVLMQILDRLDSDQGSDDGDRRGRDRDRPRWRY
jgi:hypothetical protein